jgi:hypothetical protein
MLIRVKVGDVEIEYSEPTKETDYPKCLSRDKTPEIEGCPTKHDAFIKTVGFMADKAAKIYTDINI